MFNFHKPRTYRSAEGCCICKAKSSSSRFADSRKYERDTMQCFDLKYPRQGEICNACVLLVKRFKRLPVGSKRNWSHIVDAKAGVGPGYNKIQTKHKSERITSKTTDQRQENICSTSTNNSNNGVANCTSSSYMNGLCLVPEKFSKIFKKSKKIKDIAAHNITKRKSANNGWSQNNTNSLPTTPDSLDSDYEDTKLHTSLSSNPGGSSVVQFQTQTRASAYKAQAAAEARKKIIKLGTKRRKCLPPRKYRRSISCEESLQFYDEQEWNERKSCCGMLYECPALGGALLIDTANYKPCPQHEQYRKPICQKGEKPTFSLANASNNTKKALNLPLPKSIIQSMPVVVQLQPHQGAPHISPVPTLSQSFNSKSANSSLKTPVTATPTPVLKKHHLFFKRQSECFPHGDMVATINKTNNDVSSAPTNNFNIESEQHQNHYHHNQQQPQQQQRHFDNSIHSNSLTNPPATIVTDSLTSLALSISVTSSPSSTTMPHMPKHSLAKVTTISPPLRTSIQPTQHPYNGNNNALHLVKPNNFMHKVKSDSGKIVKHSLEKFNTAVRLKPSDINEMKPIVRTVDKSCILAKPPTQANIISLNSTSNATATYQSLASYNVAAAQPPLTTTALSASSPTSSTSSTSSTKFSDNSSDSGFDENMQDRKSASPLQEDCEKKILSRPGVQTMFLASGVQIQGQPQNLVLTGNEVATKILQNRKYSTMTTSPITTISRSITPNHHPATTSVKIAQISTIPQACTSIANCVSSSISMSSAAQAKMRAIYNNNTIQHENGITTIVPASSLAATTQTAAMQNIAPSTVTITPAPPVGTQFNSQNVISRKLTTANIINLQSNTTNLSNVYNNTSGNHQHHLSSNSNNNNNNNAANQKIILLKTSPNNVTTVTTSTNCSSTARSGNCGGGR